MKLNTRGETGMKREKYPRIKAERAGEKDMAFILSTTEWNNIKDVLSESLVYTLVSTIIIQILMFLSNFMYVSWVLCQVY